jgi:hypothetical protein
MGTLTPGATYIYERVDNRIYAREFGQTKRRLVGIEQNSSTVSEPTRRMMDQINDVLVMCEQHPDMKELLDKLFVLYSLRKTHE